MILLEVLFPDPERAISVLEGWAVHATSADGTQYDGILTQFVPQDGTKTMIQIRETITDELIVATDIRNLAKIEVL